MGLGKRIADAAERVLLGSSEREQQEIEQGLHEQADKQKDESQ